MPDEVRLLDEVPDALAGSLIESLRFHVVTEDDAWLRSAHRLLGTEFEPDVLDDLSRYVGWLARNRAGTNTFPFLLLVASATLGGVEHVVGVFEGNLMRVRPRPGAAPAQGEPACIFAIGHQVTAAPIRASGVRGVGTLLFDAAVAEIHALAGRMGWALTHLFCEAEDDSLGFWSRMGFRWPEGCAYWQPPLLFDEQGTRRYDEVSEQLALKPMRGERAVSREFLLDLVATVYEHWALDKYRPLLSPAALRRAEGYVMGVVFQRVVDRAPTSPQIPLVPMVGPRRGVDERPPRRRGGR